MRASLLWGLARLKMHIYTRFWRAILTRKVGHTDLVFGVRSIQVSLVGLRIQDYKSLCADSTTSATLVNIQTHRQHFGLLICKDQPAELTKSQKNLNSWYEPWSQPLYH